MRFGSLSKHMFWWLLCLLVACWLCAWLQPGADLASSAARAFDSSVLLLSRGGTDPAMSGDNSEDDEDASHRQRRPTRSVAPKQPVSPLKTSTFRKRVTPLMQKRVAARYSFKCAVCGLPFTDSSLWEVDHIVPLSSARNDADVARLNDISNLQPVHRSPCHQMKTSREAAAR